MPDSKIERYISLLDRDLSKRKREIASLKQMLEMSSDSGHTNTLTRLSIVILYAHWEGFIKYALKEFLKNFKYEKHLPSSVLAVYLTGYARKIEFNNYVPTINRKIIDFLRLPHDISNVSIEKTFDFKSNINSEILSDILAVCDQEIVCSHETLVYQEKIINKIEILETKMKKLNELVSIRHAIAHGEQRPVSSDEAKNFIDIILHMIEDIKEIFIDTTICHFYDELN